VELKGIPLQVIRLKMIRKKQIVELVGLAIEEGGAYSVTAVADRIMTMAISIAGDDPSKIQQMRDAVEKGFSEAGLDFNKATNSDLPQICKDTCSEVINRFNKLQNKTSSSN
jgi:hypothetical protein